MGFHTFVFELYLYYAILRSTLFLQVKLKLQTLLSVSGLNSHKFLLASSVAIWNID